MKDKYFYFFLFFLVFSLHKLEAAPLSSYEQILSMQTDIQETQSKLNYFESDLSVVFDRLTEIEKNIKATDFSNKTSNIHKEIDNIQQEILKLKNYVQETQKSINNKLTTAQQANKKLIEEIAAVKKSLSAMLSYLEINETLLLENENKFYFVEAGETLSIIAKKLKVSITELKTINKLNNDKIYAGQKLIVPVK